MSQRKRTPCGSSREPLEEEIKAFFDRLKMSPDGNLIGLLQEVQEQYGYLPALALQEMSRRIRIPLSRIYGVVSFYTQFYTEPRGKHTLRCCRGTACHVNGAMRITEAIKRALGIDEHQTTSDMLFYFETVACVGTCFLAPVIMVDNRYYGNMTPGKVEKVLKSYRVQA